MLFLRPSSDIMCAHWRPDLQHSYDKDPDYLIEEAGSKSEAKITSTSAHAFTKARRVTGHRSVLEHSWEVRMYTDFGDFGDLINKSFFSALTTNWPFLNFVSIHSSLYVAGNLRAFEEWETAYPSWKAALYVKIEEMDVVKIVMAHGHTELLALTARFVCDRGVSHEAVRHRPMSPSQESSRYCDYGGLTKFIIPMWSRIRPGRYKSFFQWRLEWKFTDGLWYYAMAISSRIYKCLRKCGWKPQQARAVLPNSLKTELVITASLKEWMWIKKMRDDPAAHPQMRELMTPFFDDLLCFMPSQLRARCMDAWR